MEKVYSKIKPEEVLGIIFKVEDMVAQNTAGIDITSEKEFLQVRSLKANAKKIYSAHKHLVQLRNSDKTQESLVIIRGSIKGKFYDLDDKEISEFTLNPGDCIVLFSGGHSFEVIKDDTLFYEYKNGPYNGKVADKIFIRGENV
ncbi:MAG: hypothetical protein AABX11_04885 [Nanoarchaeota archaeon]